MEKVVASEKVVAFMEKVLLYLGICYLPPSLPHLVAAVAPGGVRGHPEAGRVARPEPLCVDGVDGGLAQVEPVPAPLVRHQHKGAPARRHANRNGENHLVSSHFS